MFIPCLINILQKISQEHITAISWVPQGTTNSPASTTPTLPLASRKQPKDRWHPHATYVCAYVHIYIYIYIYVCEIYIHLKKFGMLRNTETMQMSD
jgi:protoheme ferro-lyase